MPTRSPILADIAPRPRGGRLALAIFAASLALAGAASAQTAVQAAETAPATAPAVAAKPASAGDAESIESVVNNLLERGEFWDQRGQINVSNGFYQRVLTLQPDNVRALIGLAHVALEGGQDADAARYVERLRKLAPEEPFLVQYDTDKARPAVDRDNLYNGRKLYGAGKNTEALVEYKKLLKDGHIPLELAAEYYPLYLSTLPGDSAEAFDMLAEFGEVAKSAPKNYVLQLAYAQTMVNNEGMREDGIDKLRDLANVPSISAQARHAWRQGLLWQGADFRPQEQLEEYLSSNPSDPELEAKRAEYKAVLPSPAQRADLVAGNKFNDGKIDEAEAQFRIALSTEPEDVFANIMMAGIRKRSGHDDWRGYYETAVKQAPDRKREFDINLGLDPETNAKAAAEGARQARAKFAEVSKQVDAGHYAAAEALMNDIMHDGRNAGTLSILADIQTRAGENGPALANLREAVRLDPHDSFAQFSLCSALVKIKAETEALEHCDQANTLYAKAQDQHGIAAVATIRAGLILREAQAQPNLPQREARMKEALALDPSSAWVRVNLARTQYDLGEQAAARQTIAPVLSLALGQTTDPNADLQEAQEAGFIWSQGRGDYQSAAIIAGKVPEAKRSDDMRATLELAAIRDRARHTGGENAGLLLALAAHPDPTGERGQIIGAAFIQSHDIANLRGALTAALKSTPTPTSNQYIVYAGLLMQANQLEAAQDMLSRTNWASLSVDQRHSVEDMANALIVNRADQLLQNHRANDALHMVQEGLTRSPNSTPLQVEMSRVQVALGNSASVMPGLLAAVDKDPSNLPARMGAIDAAIAANQLRLADQLATDGMALFPRDPIMALRLANIAQMRGENSRALEAFKKARELRMSQTGAPDTATKSN